MDGVNNHEHRSKMTLNVEDERITVLESQLSAKFSPLSQPSKIGMKDLPNLSEYQKLRMVGLGAVVCLPGQEILGMVQ